MFPKLIAGLREFATRLRGGSPLHATRLELCRACRNELPAKARCPNCGGRGYRRRRVRLR
jgi:uncharacterized paraquat-inducible protein A